MHRLFSVLRQCTINTVPLPPSIAVCVLYTGNTCTYIRSHQRHYTTYPWLHDRVDVEVDEGDHPVALVRFHRISALFKRLQNIRKHVTSISPTKREAFWCPARCPALTRRKLLLVCPQFRITSYVHTSRTWTPRSYWNIGSLWAAQPSQDSNAYLFSFSVYSHHPLFPDSQEDWPHPWLALKEVPLRFLVGKVW